MEDIKELIHGDIKEEVEEDIKEQIEEPVTLAKIKDLLKAHIPKKNTLDSYCRTIQQVYDFFKIANVFELLSTKKRSLATGVASAEES
jgi:hypothetical protein